MIVCLQRSFSVCPCVLGKEHQGFWILALVKPPRFLRHVADRADNRAVDGLERLHQLAPLRVCLGAGVVHGHVDQVAVSVVDVDPVFSKAGERGVPGINQLFCLAKDALRFFLCVLDCSDLGLCRLELLRQLDELGQRILCVVRVDTQFVGQALNLLLALGDDLVHVAVFKLFLAELVHVLLCRHQLFQLPAMFGKRGHVVHIGECVRGLFGLCLPRLCLVQLRR